MFTRITALLCGLSLAAAVPAAPDEATIAGQIDGPNITFTVALTLRTTSANQTLALISGDVAVEKIVWPAAGVTPRYDLEKKTYLLTLASKGEHRVVVELSARPAAVDGGLWRQASFTLPVTDVRRVSITCDRDDVEVEFPGAGAVRVERVVESGRLTVTAMQAGRDAFAVRWKPQVRKLDAELVLASTANTVVTVGTGALRIDALLMYEIAQGRLEELKLRVPAALNITQVRGQFIRDWRLEAGTLTVTLNRAQSSRYALQVLAEMPLPTLPANLDLPVLEPIGGIGADGFLAIGTDSAIQLVVRQSSGLTQQGAAAMPRVALSPDQPRPLPEQKTFFYSHAATPYELSLWLDHIVPAYDAAHRLVIHAGLDDLSIDAQVELEVRDAPVREVTLDLPTGLTLVGVTGAAVDDYRLVTEADGGQAPAVRVRFRQPLLGKTVLNLRLELGRSPLGPKLAVGALSVRDAKNQRGYVVLSAEDGVVFDAIDAPEAKLRQVSTASVPLRTAQAQYAYRFRDVDWTLGLTARRKDAGIRAEAFHLVWLGEGVALGNVAVSCFITGSPVDELRFVIDPKLQNIEFVGRDVRRWTRDEADPSLWTVKLQRKVIGDYNLAVTYSQRYAGGDALVIGGVTCAGVETQTGYVCVASHLDMRLSAGGPGTGLIEIDREEVPANYRLLVSAPLLRSYKYVSAPHRLELSVDPYQRGSLLPVVIEFMRIDTRVAPRTDDHTESFTTVRYKIKNSSSQFLALTMPADAKVWATRLIEIDEHGQETAQRLASSFDAASNQLLIPLRRPRDPNLPITVELEYGQVHRPLGWEGAVLLTAPASEVRGTFDHWTVTVPEKWAIHPAADPAMKPEDRPARHGDLGRLLTTVGAAWAWSLMQVFDYPQGPIGAVLVTMAVAIALIVARRSAVTVLTLAALALATWGGAAAAVSPVFRQRAYHADDLTRLTFTQVIDLDTHTPPVVRARIVPSWRQHAGIAATIVPGAIGLSALALSALPRRRRAVLCALGLTLTLLAGATLDALTPWLAHLLTWGVPGIILCAYLYQLLLHRPHALTPAASAVAATMLALVLLITGCAAAPAPARTTDPPLILDRLDAQLSAQSDNVAMTLTLQVTAGKPTALSLLDEQTILLSSELSSNPNMRLERDGSRYRLRLLKAGRYTATLRCVRPLAPAGEEQVRDLALALPPAINKTVTLTIPETGLNVQAPGAVRLSRQEADGKTTAALVLGPTDDLRVTWRPRARQRELESTSFYASVISVMSFDTGMIAGRHSLRLEVAQGQLELIRLMIPPNMTVTSVSGAGLGAWRFDPVTHELEARLGTPATGEYHLLLATQTATDKLPYAASLGAIRVVEAARQRGVMGLVSSPAVYATVSNHPQAINVADLTREAAALLTPPGGGAAPEVRFAFRMDQPDDRVEAQVLEVRPELRSTENAGFTVADDRLVYNGIFTVEVSKAGVFALTLAIPEGYDIDALTAEQVSHWDENVAAGRRLVAVHLTSKVIGEVALTVTMSRPVSELPRQLTVPRLEAVGALKHSGRIVISSERGVRLTVSGRNGVSELNAVESGVNLPGALAFALLRPNWDLSLVTEVIEPRVTVDYLHVARVSEGLVRHTHQLRYQLQHAGARTFDVEIPAGAMGLLISGPTIARLAEVEPGSGRWHVELAGKWFDQPYPLTVQYETPFDRDRGDLTLSPVRALGTDLQRGYVAVFGGDRVELSAVKVEATLTTAEARTAPREFGAGDLAQAALCYRGASGDYALTLRATRHGAAAVLDADVLDTTLTTVLTERGQSITAVSMRLRVGAKRHLETLLPAGAEVWSLLVNGRASVPSLRTDAAGRTVHLVPLAQSAAGDLPVLVEMIYVQPDSPASRWNKPTVEGPKFDLPLKNIRWVMYTPDGFDLSGFGGTLEVSRQALEQRVILAYGAGEYEQQVQRFNVQNLRKAAELQDRARDLEKQGQHKAARQALESAWYYSLSDEALNEDNRVQLHRLAQQQALMGLVGSRQRLRQQPGAVDTSPQQSQGERFDPAQVDRVRSSLLKEDSENLDAIIGRMIQTQEAAAGAAIPLVVNMPLRGRVIEFTRAIQVEPNADMKVWFTATPTVTERFNVEYLWAVGLFLALTAVFVSIGPAARAYARWRARPQTAPAQPMTDDTGHGAGGYT